VSDRVLVIEDDAALGAQVVTHLERAGFKVRWLRDGDEARDVELDGVRLVVLDLMLPGIYGLDLLRIFRTRSDVPVIVLTARNETADKVRALELGADDYVTKPFWPEELVARVQARLRRPIMTRGELLRAGTLEIDLAAHSASVAGASVELTHTELELLAALARRPGAALTRRALVEAALDLGTERTLDVHVSRLRKKLPEGAPRIVTVWGIGYRLEVDPVPSGGPR
jgi:two-component system response regulator MtrA